MTLSLFFSLLVLLPVILAAPAASPTVTITSPQATIIGLGGKVEAFPGIPFAKPPVGPLRLKPPQALTSPLGTYLATSNGKACPQFFFSTVKNDAIPTSVLGLLLNTPLFQTILNTGEDCLNINVHRPAGTKATDKLPVLFWIFGGGFELGWNSMYDGAPWVSDSVAQGKPIIFVTVNYRVGGFGFLPGAEILADGAANLGLLDQRLGLEWVADNIAAFGGDPEKVTIWGESAGAISVLDQMALYDGDHKYRGKPLFRAAIMNVGAYASFFLIPTANGVAAADWKPFRKSGSIVPADPVDCPKGQDIYDTVVKAAGCASSGNTLDCLRAAPYATFHNATNSVSGLLSYSSVALSYLPRPDGTALTTSPEVLIATGKYAKVPFIIGNQEDEGTLFALFQSNITSKAQLVTYLNTLFFHSASKAQIEELVATYPETIIDGSPFRSGILNNIYPQFKRLAAILGDLSFTLTRRSFMNIADSVAPDVPSWAYMSSYDLGTPVLGTFHGSDLLQVFFGILPNYASMATRAYYLSFVKSLNPNIGSGFKNWPRWSEGKQLMNFYPLTATLIKDDFRGDTYNFILNNVGSLRI